MLPFCGVWPDRLRPAVIFDNSLADCSWYYSRSHVVGPSELDLVNAKLPVDGSHYLTPPNPLWLNWRSATGGDWKATLDVRDTFMSNPEIPPALDAIGFHTDGVARASRNDDLFCRG